jgi:hypothetical protein
MREAVAAATGIALGAALSSLVRVVVRARVNLVDSQGIQRSATKAAPIPMGAPQYRLF